MAKAKDASTVGIHLPNTIIAELDRRAKIVGYTRSKYTAALVNRWYARGAEPILQIEVEQLLPIPLQGGGQTWIGAAPRSGSLMGFAAQPGAVHSPTAQLGVGGGASPIESAVASETGRRRSQSKRAKNSA